MKKQKLKTRLFLISMLTLPVAFGGVCSMIDMQKFDSFAESAISNNNYAYEKIDIQNGSFNSSSSAYTSSVSGWEKIKDNSKAKVLAIDTVSKFDEYYKSTYYLENKSPGKIGQDDKVLMINSTEKKPDSDKSEENFVNDNSEGMRSDDIALEPNSNYVFKASMKTMDLGGKSPFGSVYLTGLKDEDGKSQVLSFENQTNSNWTTFYFFVKTGNEKQTVNLELWLGSEKQSTTGAVFFDEVSCLRYSENEWTRKEAEYISKFTSETKTINLESSNNIMKKSDNTVDLNDASYNFNFENTAGWESNTVVIKNLQGGISGTEMNPGLDFSNDNTSALVLDTNGKGFDKATQTKEIPVERNEILKISFMAKSDFENGTFEVKIDEQDDIHEKEPSLTDIYDLHESTFDIGKTDGDNFSNNYEKVEIFVKGHELFDSSIKMSFEFENLAEEAGYAVVDNIFVEYATTGEYNNATNKIEFHSSKGDFKIENSLFNFVKIEDADDILHNPENWTVETEGERNESGVLNTNFIPSSFISQIPTTNAPIGKYGSNNVFTFKNVEEKMQTITQNNSTSLEKNKYYEISFDFATTNNSKLNFNLENDKDILLIDSQISTDGGWQTFKGYVFTGETAHNVNLSLAFNEIGYAFMDNFKIEESNETAFENASTKADLSSLLLNLDSKNQIGDEISNHSAYEKINNVGNCNAGVINGSANKIFTDSQGNFITDTHTSENNILAITSRNNSETSVKSKFAINVESEKYYSLKFKLFTTFKDIDELDEKDEDGSEIAYDFGVSVGLSTFDQIINISSKDAWCEFEILFKSVKSEESNLVFTLTSQNKETQGNAFLTDILFEESTQEVFDASQNKDSFNKTLFTTTTSAEVDEDLDDDNNDESEEPETQNDINWLLIPSIITGIAVIIGVIGVFIQKLKFGKKKGKKSKANYDRKETLDKDIIEKEALALQKEAVERTQKGIDNSTKELESLEIQHKEYTQSQREKQGGKVTKEIERKFKNFSSQKAKILARINSMNETLKTYQSKDYLISMEKKVITTAQGNYRNEVKKINLENKIKLKNEKDFKKQEKADNNEKKETIEVKENNNLDNKDNLKENNDLDNKDNLKENNDLDNKE